MSNSSRLFLQALLIFCPIVFSCSGGKSDKITSDGGEVGICHDGIVDPEDQCDNKVADSTTCTTLGFAGGTLSCGNDCQFDTSACTRLDTCGNGSLDTLELCEGFDLRGKTCATEGYVKGELRCTSGCTHDASDCTHCGDNIRQTGEECDGNDFGAKSCVTELNNSYFEDGLVCNDDCTAIDDKQCKLTKPSAQLGKLCTPGGGDCVGNGISCLLLGEGSTTGYCSLHCKNPPANDICGPLDGFLGPGLGFCAFDIGGGQYACGIGCAKRNNNNISCPAGLTCDTEVNLCLRPQ